MPSHKIHMAIAKKVNDVLKLDLDSVMLGSIMPDVCIGKNHTVSHLQNGKLGVDGTANPDLFIKKQTIRKIKDYYRNTLEFKNKLNNLKGAKK